MTGAAAKLMSLCVEVAAPVEIEAGPNGRRFVPITGGSVSGSLSGRVLQGGGDWQTLCPDGRLEIRAHYILEIDDHGTVEVQSQGVRHGPPDVVAALTRGEPVEPAAYYFRTAMRFRTSAPGLVRLNSILAYSIGTREVDRVRLEVMEIL